MARDGCQGSGRYTRRDFAQRRRDARRHRQRRRAGGPARRRPHVSAAARVHGAGQRQRPRDLRAGRRRLRGLVGELGARARVGGAVGAGARLEPALGQMVRRRQDQRLLQLPRPPRRGRERRPRRLLLGGRGRRAAHDHLLRPARDDEPVRERAEGPGRRARRPRRDLHADGPRGAGRDAGMRAHRRAALGRVRRVLRPGRGRPHQRLRGEGAGDRRLLAAARQAAPDEGERRRDPAELPFDRALRGGAPYRRRRSRGRRVATSGGTRRAKRHRPTARPTASTPSRRSSCSTPPAPRRSRRASCTRPAAT